MSDQLAGAAQIWYVHCYQAKRTEGFYERGIYQRNSSALSWHQGNIQPASKAQIERLPEGGRADGAITIYTQSTHRTAAAPNDLADRVLYQGVEYEISAVEHWPAYNEYLCTKVGQ